MEEAKLFLTIIVPLIFFSISIFVTITSLITNYYQWNAWDKIDKECDQIDEDIFYKYFDTEMLISFLRRQSV